MDGFVGSIASEPTLRVGWLCHSARQCWPPSSLFQTPPPAAPTQMVLDFFGAQTIEVIRPPMLVGPTNSHGAVPAKGASAAATRERSRGSPCAEGSLKGHADRAWNQTVLRLCVVVLGAGRPRGRAFFGPFERSMRRAAFLRGAFTDLRAAFPLLLDFAMNAPIYSPKRGREMLKLCLPPGSPSAGRRPRNASDPTQAEWQGEGADQRRHRHLADIDDDEPWLARHFTAENSDQ